MEHFASDRQMNICISWAPFGAKKSFEKGFNESSKERGLNRDFKKERKRQKNREPKGVL